ncbi:hypothetical protein DEA8626_03903 [Defluviimonas aquaemixtae]|uniref:Nitrogen fixation protein FixH n=1 Tax=Albidovulum aquaemixtae TaxID=1542388 RepID=A0A2R8BN53_9RHOB|nr:FixH family protein [Defluviimonas aquaemixtae]SPH24869.1 hypothetical protein DEA8626_03903 [Defluviimonas aquaemixtae]
MKGELTGRKVFFIAASAFAVIIGVNVVMAVQAVRTFPGLEVKNSYVASQRFEAARAAQEALGWSLSHSYEAGTLRLKFRGIGGRPVQVDRLTALVGRTTEAANDISPAFVWDGSSYSAPAELGPGKWMILLEAYAGDGTLFHQRLNLFVRD